MSQHTPGAWYTKREGFSTVYVFSRRGGGLIQEVAACGPTYGPDEQEHNARLIAAAPDLLAVADMVLATATCHTDPALVAAATEAIRKAKGDTA